MPCSNSGVGLPAARAGGRAVLARIALGLALALGAAMGQADAASLDGLAVDVVNRTEPVLCAEKDNVTLAFSAPNVRSFRLEAAHPAYAASLSRDSFEADWTACDMSADPVHKEQGAPPVFRRSTIYEEVELWVVGWRFPSFWRPATAKVRIGDRVEEGLHMLQVWALRPMGGEEILVVYPQDGYWRIRPLAPKGLAPTAFGSSFLVGPIEEDGRPIVKISELAFDPKSKTFTVSFERGGQARIRIVEASANKHAVDVAYDKPVTGRPFAMLRSMYVTEFNNDAAKVAVREKGARGWREEGIMGFRRATATDIWLGRTSPSQHNTSSPDIVLNSFSDTAEPMRPKAEKPR